MTRHPSKPRALRPVKTTRDSTRRWTRSGRGRDLDLRDKRGVVRARLREAADTLALENASLRPRALLSAAERNRARPRAPPQPLCDARLGATPAHRAGRSSTLRKTPSRPRGPRRLAASSASRSRRRGGGAPPSGRSPTVVTSRDVGSATRRAGFDGASASASRLREAAEVVSAMDATLERARVMEYGAAGGADGSRGGRATNRAGAVEVPAHGDGLDGAECARGPRGRVISG